MFPTSCDSRCFHGGMTQAHKLHACADKICQIFCDLNQCFQEIDFHLNSWKDVAYSSKTKKTGEQQRGLMYCTQKNINVFEITVAFTPFVGQRFSKNNSLPLREFK